MGARRRQREDSRWIDELGARARPLATKHDLRPLIDQLSRSRVVMLGESTHGTHEFYELRRLISEWLIVKHGFRFIAVEGDWPSCGKVDRYIRSSSPGPEGGSARETLEAFDRWPTWMWANTEVIRLAEWLRSHNSAVREDRQVGFHGLDFYSLFESIDAILADLHRINPFLIRRITANYRCFEAYRGDEKKFTQALLTFPEGCEREVVDTLHALMECKLDGLKDREELLFDAQQNARVVANAEKYYRTLVHGNGDSWNVRDGHMLETLDVLLNRYGPEARAIVWAHNTHIGDYRATSMKAEGQVNLGGLAREKWGPDQVALVGFACYEGQVTASPSWGGPIHSLRLPPATADSVEGAFHAVAQKKDATSLVVQFDARDHEGVHAEFRGQRAVGVVFDPAHEGFSSYVPTALSRRYDALVFVDRTRALEPLIQGVEPGEIPETWPRGQ